MFVTSILCILYLNIIKIVDGYRTNFRLNISYKKFIFEKDLCSWLKIGDILEKEPIIYLPGIEFCTDLFQLLTFFNNILNWMIISSSLQLFSTFSSFSSSFFLSHRYTPLSTHSTFSYQTSISFCTLLTWETSVEILFCLPSSSSTSPLMSSYTRRLPSCFAPLFHKF